MVLDTGLVFLTLFLLLILAGLIFLLLRQLQAKRILAKCMGWEQLDEEKQILHKKNQDLLPTEDYTSGTANGISSYGDKAFCSEIGSSDTYSYQEISDQLATSKSEKAAYKALVDTPSSPTREFPSKPDTIQSAPQKENFDQSSASIQIWPTDLETTKKSSQESPRQAAPKNLYTSSESTMIESSGAEISPITTARNISPQPTPMESQQSPSKRSDRPISGLDEVNGVGFSQADGNQKLFEFDSPKREGRSSSLSSEDSFLERISDDTGVGGCLTRAISSDSIDSTCSAMDLVNEDQDLGQLEVKLLYESASQIFHLWVLQALDVRVAGGFSDAEFWIVVFLLPHPKPLWRTQLRKSSGNNIQFHEEFKQCIRSKDLPKVALLCQMFYRRLGAQEVSLVGQTRVRLRDVSLTEQTNTLWLSVLPHTSEVEDRNLGDILLSLSYMPIAERLTVVVSKLKHLKSEDDHPIEKVLVRVYLVQGAKVSKKKTSLKSTVDGAVTFNESMIFNLSQSKFSKVYLRVSVTEVTSDGEHVTTGHVTVGSRRSGKELGHWQKLMSSENQNSRKPLAMWHSILPKKF